VIGVKFTGVGKVAANLTALTAKVPLVVQAALREEAEIEMTEAKKRTPVDLGALRSSGTVTTSRSGTSVRAELGFGGAAAPYAIYVHEDLDAYHKVGDAKFLESTIRESAPHMPARVAANVAQRLGTK
jgi:hypothetical protein